MGESNANPVPLVLPEYINVLVEAGIDVTIMQSSDPAGWCLDMNTGAKSHLHLTRIDGEWVALMRDNEAALIQGFNDLLETVRSCMRGYDTINRYWGDLLVRCGLLTLATKTTATYRFT